MFSPYWMLATRKAADDAAGRSRTTDVGKRRFAQPLCFYLIYCGEPGFLVFCRARRSWTARCACASKPVILFYGTSDAFSRPIVERLTVLSETVCESAAGNAASHLTPSSPHFDTGQYLAGLRPRRSVPSPTQSFRFRHGRAPCALRREVHGRRNPQILTMFCFR